MVWILQMRRGFIRLQATFRARKVRRRYVRTRRRIMGFQVRYEECHTSVLFIVLEDFFVSLWQRYCRGWIVRKSCRRKIRAAIKIQSLFRMVLAKKRFRKLKIEVCNTIYWEQFSVYTCTYIFSYKEEVNTVCATFNVNHGLVIHLTLIPEREREREITLIPERERLHWYQRERERETICMMKCLRPTCIL